MKYVDESNVTMMRMGFYYDNNSDKPGKNVPSAEIHFLHQRE